MNVTMPARRKGESSREYRRRCKRHIRAERKARYLSEAAAGKERRDAAGLSRFSATKHQHVIPNCGNVGCQRCYPPAPSVRQ